MKITDIRKKSIAELEKSLMEKEKALHDFKFGISGSKVKNVREGRNIKKEIAQIKTIVVDLKKTQ
jgi:ribosomal protein L29